MRRAADRAGESLVAELREAKRLHTSFRGWPAENVDEFYVRGLLRNAPMSPVELVSSDSEDVLVPDDIDEEVDILEEYRFCAPGRPSRALR